MSESQSQISTMAETSPPPGKAKLIYCKAHVAIHPTALRTDNIPGYLGIVQTCVRSNEASALGDNVLVTWVPEVVLERMDAQDREGYKKIGEKSDSEAEIVENEYVFVSVPPPKGEQYAFSIPVASIYSILVYPPSLTYWYGSATLNLIGGVSLPTLYFHDDESPLLDPSQPRPRSSVTASPLKARWGFPPFLSALSSHALLIQSKLVQPKKSKGAQLWLVNPSKADRQVHEAEVEDEDVPTVPTHRRSSSAGSLGIGIKPGVNYPPKPTYPALANINTASPRQSILTSLSTLTNLSRKKASQILSHPLAQPVVPHLPPAVRSFVNAPGELEKLGRKNGDNEGGKGKQVEEEFESARLYLAKWARVVAEEGEKNRRSELAAQARLPTSTDPDGVISLSHSPTEEDLSSTLGAFSLLPKTFSKRPIPSSTRVPEEPITLTDWRSFETDARPEEWVRCEIFRRGFSDDPIDVQARREGWEVLLGSIPWKVGGLRGGEEWLAARRKERAEVREGHRQVYEQLKHKWRADIEWGASSHKEESGTGRNFEGWQEEWHRIDVDCRRTDRTHPMFAVPSPSSSDAPKSPKIGTETYSVKMSWDREFTSKETTDFGFDGKMDEEEAGSARLNSHIASLRLILMTYHFYSPSLGYVQGMSDLLSPIYYVFDGNEADSFWALVGLMQGHGEEMSRDNDEVVKFRLGKQAKGLEENFLRDQSGMKRQLSTLLELLSVMDPGLYNHLEQTSSLNLFFTYRWILILFKREFPFSTIPRLWDVLFTSYYSYEFVLFVALSILQQQREVIIRYLREFDEVLKYVNDLSGTINIDSTIAQAEVLFLTFRSLVQDLDRDNVSTCPQSAPKIKKENESEGQDKADAAGRDKNDDMVGQINGGKEIANKIEDNQNLNRIISTNLRSLLIGWTPKDSKK
ncbi:uncharacterized protein L203_101217 [Cryptococcus depauperatus CBS 7841]|uniref:Rab-GAP TBC domain-containing protein n=1 Tax=Cryptococcus depauperatus CBS 7841 TaxID=1295531 RepID=A0AAJ8JPN3_9TREE